MNTQFNRQATCPWCGKGTVMADGKGKVTVSVKCEKCRHCFTVDLDNMKTERCGAQKKLGRRQ